MYKSIVVGEDSYSRKSPRDLLHADVIYKTGVSGVIYLNRAAMNRVVFEMNHKGKIMKETDFENYRDLVLAEERTERSFDEE